MDQNSKQRPATSPMRRGLSRRHVVQGALGLGVAAALPSVRPVAADDSVTLTMTFWGSKQDQETYTRRAAMVTDKYPNIKVNAVLIPTDYDQKVQTMIAGGRSPDILELAESVHSYSTKGQIIPLNDYITGAKIDMAERYGEGVPAKFYDRDGQTWAMRDRGGAMTLYYNKDLFDAAGVAYPSAKWTWDDLLSAAEALTVRDGDKTSQWGLAVGGWWPWWVSFIYQNGGMLIDADGKPAINSPEAVEAITFYVDLHTKHHVAPTPKDYANAGQGVGPDQLFSQGKAAMTMTGFWAIGTFSSVPNLNWDIATLFGGKKPGTLLMANGLAISKDCKHPAEAFQAIEFLTSVDGQRPIVESRTDAPANQELLKSPDFLDFMDDGRPINMAAFSESLDRLYLQPMIPQWDKMMEILNIDQLLTGDKQVEPTLNQMQAELEKAVSK